MEKQNDEMYSFNISNKKKATNSSKKKIIVIVVIFIIIALVHGGRGEVCVLTKARIFASLLQ